MMADLLEFPTKLHADRKIIHVDMDAFYAQIEMRDHPEYQNVPIILARDPRKTGGHGVVATANYMARKQGVHSAMSAAEALKLAPEATFVPPNFSLYREVSTQVHQVFHQLTDKIEPIAFDEAYLDLSDYEQDPVMLAHWLQQTIYQQLTLTSSVGISFNKFLAKLASEHNKPAGLTVVRPEDIRDFLDPLPIEAIRGVGQKTAVKMHDLSINTARDLYKQSLATLEEHFGRLGFTLFKRIRGVDERPVQWQRQRKSIGKEHTFTHFIDGDQAVLTELRSLAHELVLTLQRKDQHGKTLVLKVRDDRFETRTHRRTGPDFIRNDERMIQQLAQDIWEDMGGYERPIRLLGLTMTNLQPVTFTEMPLNLYE
ncbi:DNA polymerase IV [Weissella halotolerans]|uniref:DNA polymerase IV n=1 Tax=Weissella halotolerans TaxID=1615 RepID=UPI00146D4F32|nr:DNA polymerase IV [Weissella halotolerans]